MVAQEDAELTSSRGHGHTEPIATYGPFPAERICKLDKLLLHEEKIRGHTETGSRGRDKLLPPKLHAPPMQ